MEQQRSYRIHEVAQLTGLAPARLRVWERRYDIIRPRRRPNGYRAYSGRQVALLRLYARLTGAGERIGKLVVRPVDEAVLLAESHAFDGWPQAALLRAVKALDRERLESLIARQRSRRGPHGFVTDVVLPLAQALGDLWALGAISIAAEHMASEVVVHALKSGLRRPHGSGPLLAAGCLPGERHEWGILATLVLLQEKGWRIRYLGPDLPVHEGIECSWRLLPTAVGFSGHDPDIVRRSLPALAAVPRKLPPGTIPVIGGRGVVPHTRVLRTQGFRIGMSALRARAR